MPTGPALAGPMTGSAENPESRDSGSDAYATSRNDGSNQHPCDLSKAASVFSAGAAPPVRLSLYIMHSKTDTIQSSAEALRYPWENHPGPDQVVELMPGVLWLRLKLQPQHEIGRAHV